MKLNKGRQEKIFIINFFVFQAVSEPSFSVAYAQMCQTLQKMEFPSSTPQANGTQEPETFKKLLLVMCQKEFEKNSKEEVGQDEKTKEIEQEKDPVRYLCQVFSMC